MLLYIYRQELLQVHSQELLRVRGEEEGAAPRRRPVHVRGHLLRQPHLPHLHDAAPYPPSRPRYCGLNCRQHANQQLPDWFSNDSPRRRSGPLHGGRWASCTGAVDSHPARHQLDAINPRWLQCRRGKQRSGERERARLRKGHRRIPYYGPRRCHVQLWQQRREQHGRHLPCSSRSTWYLDPCGCIRGSIFCGDRSLIRVLIIMTVTSSYNIHVGVGMVYIYRFKFVLRS